MYAYEHESDLAAILKTAYAAPLPRDRFVRDLLAQMKQQLGDAERVSPTSGGAGGGSGSGSPGRSPWRWFAAAAVLIVVGLAAAVIISRSDTSHPSTPVATTGEKTLVAEGPAKMVALEIAEPLPMFDGTPKNIDPRPTLEKYVDRPRPKFLVPEGTTNLALDRPVTASDMDPIIGEIKCVTDGKNEGGDGFYVELGPGVQWVQIDLGQQANLYALVMWHYHSEGRVYHDVVIQVSDDRDFIQGVKTIYNNDFDNSAGLGIGKDLEYIEDYRGRLVDAKGVQGRYVRLYSNGNTSNDQNHYIEVMVFGKPVAGAAPAVPTATATKS